MGMFATRRRRGTTAGPGARREPPSDRVPALPPRFEAVGEALASGSGSVAACEVLGEALAEGGTSLVEALDALAATARLVTGRDPSHADTRALAVAWTEAVLTYLNNLSCDDPLTGLATAAHLRSRIRDVYREGLERGTPPGDSHALVVVAAARASMAAGRDQVLREALHDARVGESVRTVFSGPETIARVAPGRLAVLTERDERLGRRLGLLRRLVDGGSFGGTGDQPPAVRTWVEGLPPSDRAAGRLLDELARL